MPDQVSRLEQFEIGDQERHSLPGGLAIGFCAPTYFEQVFGLPISHLAANMQASKETEAPGAQFASQEGLIVNSHQLLEDGEIGFGVVRRRQEGSQDTSLYEDQGLSSLPITTEGREEFDLRPALRSFWASAEIF